MSLSFTPFVRALEKGSAFYAEGVRKCQPRVTPWERVAVGTKNTESVGEARRRFVLELNIQTLPTPSGLKRKLNSVSQGVTLG